MSAVPRSTCDVLQRAAVTAVLLAATAGLAGCSSMVDQIPTWAGGLPAGAPERPAAAPSYPAVHDMPPARNDTVLNDAERKKLKDELNATRSQTESNISTAETTGSAPAAAGRPPKP